MQPFIGIILGFVLILTRISAFFVILPIFGSEIIPAIIKVAAVVLVTIFFSMVTSLPFDAGNVTALQAGLLMAGEAVYGLALGLIANCIFSVVRLAGRIIEQQMGLDMAQVMDPITGESADPLSVLLEMVFIVLFLAANGHHLLLMVICAATRRLRRGLFRRCL